MRDFFRFHKMLTPGLIQILFYLSLLFIVFAAIYTMIQNHQYGIGIQILIFGTLGSRILCEFMIVIFKIHANLESINQKLTDR